MREISDLRLRFSRTTARHSNHAPIAPIAAR
jgi:hypothetical protein